MSREPVSLARSLGVSGTDVQSLWAHLMVEEMVRNGVDTFFVAPGSRSTPLTVAVARHEEAEVVLHVDERGTAFAALGVGRATRRPAGWITTSGTAVANGYPAVVEAAVDGVPLLLLTADRPPELRDTGANQTIDQVKIFGDYVRWQADVPPPTTEIDPSYVLTTVDQAVHQARRLPGGPVHLNCAFRKPLEPADRGESVTVEAAVADWAQSNASFTDYPTPRSEPPASTVDELAGAAAESTSGLIVAGRLDSNADARAARRLADTMGWPLLPDLTSQVRLGCEADDAVIPYGNLVLCADRFRALHAPDVVFQMGGRFTSKRIRHFLRDTRPSPWAVIRPDPTRLDPDHRVTHHVESSVVPFVDAFLARLSERNVNTESHVNAWRDASARAKSVLSSHVDGHGLTEPAVAALVTQHLPETHAVVAGSSMPIRDLNRHAAGDGAGVPAYANRGASGIDGTVATAAGVAKGEKRAVTLLIGDVALWHDLNSLALLHDTPVIVVVVNNDGGGIFHFLPIREHEDVFDPYFSTPHGRSFSSAAETFGLEYEQPTSTDEFLSAYRSACSNEGPTLIEVQTDREENRRLHEQLEAEVARAIEGRG